MNFNVLLNFRYYLQRSEFCRGAVLRFALSHGVLGLGRRHEGVVAAHRLQDRGVGAEQGLGLPQDCGLASDLAVERISRGTL